MGWTLLEARTEIGRLKTELADSDVFFSQASEDAIDYLITQAERYEWLKTDLEDIVYKIQIRDSQND